MAPPLITPPFNVPFFNKQTQDIHEQWKRYLLALTNQIAAIFAPVDGSYVVTADVPGLVNQFNLGLLTDGILKQTVTAAVATPAIALAGTDYTDAAFKTIAVSGQSDVVADSPADLLTLIASTGMTITTSAAGDSITFASSASATVTKTIGVTIDGQGSVITTGIKGYVQFPVAGTITGWTILSTDATTPTTGSIVFDIFKGTFAGYPPTTSITAAAKPTITTNISATSTSVGTWTTAINAGDCLGFNVDSVTSFTRVILEVTVTVP